MWVDGVNVNILVCRDINDMVGNFDEVYFFGFCNGVFFFCIYWYYDFCLWCRL